MKQKPNSDWANWALCAELDDPSNVNRPAVLELVATRFRQLVGDRGTQGPRAFVVATSCGHWGRGDSMSDAARSAKKAGAKLTSRASIWYVLNDATPEINEGGRIITESRAEILNVGPVNRLSALITP